MEIPPRWCFGATASAQRAYGFLIEIGRPLRPRSTKRVCHWSGPSAKMYRAAVKAAGAEA